MNGKQTQEKSFNMISLGYMQITTINCCHNTPTFMTKIQKTEHTKGCVECGTLRCLGRCCWECKILSSLWETACQFLKAIYLPL